MQTLDQEIKKQHKDQIVVSKGNLDDIAENQRKGASSGRYQNKKTLIVTRNIEAIV
jgi:hypothetical protein